MRRYIDIADAISRTRPTYVRADLEQFYRRMTFNVLAGNRDDHLRNHGFLRCTEAGDSLRPSTSIRRARCASTPSP